MPIPKNSTKTRWLKWYHMYYFLAVFCVLTISASVYLFHAVLAIYTVSVAEDAMLANRSSQFSNLSQLAAAVNAPGNDAFDSGDVVGEQQKLSEACLIFQAAITSARNELQKDEDRSASSPLIQHLDDIDAQVLLVQQEAIAVFRALEKKDLAYAGSRMAEMDRCFSKALAQIGSLSEAVRAIQSARFSAQAARAHWLGHFESILVGLTLLILIIVVGFGRKMAKQMRYEEARSTRFEEQIAAISRSQMVIEFDVDGTILSANDKFLNAMGYSLNEIVGQHHRIFIEPEQRSSDEYWDFWDRLNRGEYVSEELKRIHKDGREVWLQATYNPIFDIKNKPYKYVKFSVDISERVLATQELAIAKLQLLRTSAFGDILERSLNEIYIFDATTFHFMHVNRGAQENIGYTLEELQGMTPVDIKPRHTLASFNELIAPLRAETQNNIEFTALHRRKNGSEYPVAVHLETSVMDGKKVFIAVILDITERTRTEALLQLKNAELIKARSDAESANRAKSEFLANMSHEIRTPLTAILGFADLLYETGDISLAPTERVHTIDTIKNAGAHLLTVINDILDLSKIEADMMTIECIDTPLVTILREVESLMRPRAAGKGVALNAVLLNPVPEHIHCDPTRLRQILMNLAGNSAKFTEAGFVSMSVSTEGQDGKSRLVIDIEDTGPGMSPDQAQRLFGAFCQADSTITRKHGGSGLGLNICRRLAKMMGGDVILLRTELGKGSCFRLVLPLDAVAGSAIVTRLDALQEPEADKPNVDKPTAVMIQLSGRILLAEDGIDNQRLIAFHLKKAGAIVEVADNGLIALAMLDKAEAAGTPYDLLLTDMQMPEMDGYTLARTLRARGSTLPIVALTAHAMTEDRDKCMSAGCDDYASKPIDKARLLETCAAAMNKRVAAIVPSMNMHNGMSSDCFSISPAHS